jgi:hypothetical protein
VTLHWKIGRMDGRDTLLLETKSWARLDAAAQGVFPAKLEHPMVVSHAAVRDFTAFPAVIALTSLDGSNGFKMTSETTGDYAGRTVSNAGDVNGDGFADVIIGARNAGPANTGAAYVVFGAESGFAANLNLSTLDGDNGFKIVGAAEGDNAGWGVSNAGDVNGDGIDDVMVGARNADQGGSSSGNSYVVFGSEGGFAASINLASLDGDNGFRLKGEAASFRRRAT